MWISDKWKDYELIDTSGGERLERWGEYFLIRPDPQVIWNTPKNDPRWRKAHGVYRRSKSGGGQWSVSDMPDSWTIGYGNLTFKLRPMGFKHTGIFPEQAVNWDWCSSLIEKRINESGRAPSIINLFAYTGGATAAAAFAGASVCHVDASKGMVQAAKENLLLSGLSEAPVRYIVDDCVKFVEREIRRGRKYDGIIMDPPSYGRGPGGEIWKIEESIFDFLKLTVKLLSDTPLFFLINSYTTGLSPASMGYMLGKLITPEMKKSGEIEAGELGLPVSDRISVLPAGASCRWSAY